MNFSGWIHILPLVFPYLLSCQFFNCWCCFAIAPLTLSRSWMTSSSLSTTSPFQVSYNGRRASNWTCLMYDNLTSKSVSIEQFANYPFRHPGLHRMFARNPSLYLSFSGDDLMAIGAFLNLFVYRLMSLIDLSEPLFISAYHLLMHVYDRDCRSVMAIYVWCKIRFSISPIRLTLDVFSSPNLHFSPFSLDGLLRARLIGWSKK